ncbi:MAG: hypothetical protein Q9164_007065, partial [Protoblastenia rupestris]
MIDDEQDTSYIDLDYFLPDAPGMHVVITSRSSTAREITALEAVAVGEMEPFEATELFQRAAKMKEVKLEVKEEIERIGEELGYLALAITLAGSYVSMTPRLQSDIKRYLPEYRQRRKELLQRQPEQHVHRYKESVLSTWETSFEAIAKQSPAAARLLGLLAFVNFEDIFPSLFGAADYNTSAEGSEHIAEKSKSTGTSQPKWQLYLSSGQKWTLYDLESSFETLQSYYLLQWRSDQKSYAMHKLVHAWGQDRLDGEEQQRLSGLAIQLIADATTQRQFGSSYQLRLVPHAIACFNSFFSRHQTPHELGRGQLVAIERIGDFLYQIGRYSEALKVQNFHFTEAMSTMGKKHPDALRSMNKLASILSSQSRYEEADRLYRQVLALEEEVLGKEHAETFGTSNNLALVLMDQGKYEEAERIHRQTLRLRELML